MRRTELITGRPTATVGLRLGAEDGQIMPILMITLILVVIVGALLFQVARGTDARARAQTAADAAALAGARQIRSQLETVAVGGGVEPTAVDMGGVRAAADEYARRNGARVTKLEQIGGDVRVAVATEDELGDPAEPIDSEHARGTARARAGARVVGSVGERGAGEDSGTRPTGGDGHVSDADWDALREMLAPMQPPDNVVALGRFLRRHGFHVSGNAAFDPGVEPQAGAHRRHDGRGALDVNYGCRCGDMSPAEVAAITPLIPELRGLGFNTLWNVGPGDHQDHLHVDTLRLGAGDGDAAGFIAASGDVRVELRLVALDDPAAGR